MLSHQNGYKCSQAKDRFGIEVEWCLKSKVVKKASVKGDVPQVATDLC